MASNDMACLGTQDIPQGHHLYPTPKTEGESRNYLPGCVTIRRLHILPSFGVYGADILHQSTPGIPLVFSRVATVPKPGLITRQSESKQA
jgi:hypothetical protein